MLANVTQTGVNGALVGDYFPSTNQPTSTNQSLVPDTKAEEGVNDKLKVFDVDLADLFQ